jgi:predicted MFS family arabinose efflux permease
MVRKSSRITSKLADRNPYRGSPKGRVKRESADFSDFSHAPLSAVWRRNVKPQARPADSRWRSIRDSPPTKPGTKRSMAGATVDEAEINIRTLVFALLALACGHMLSTLLRTIPAISLDVMAADFATPVQTLASLTAVYHFGFAAAQIPVGAALDRFGVRPVSLSLLIGTVAGASLSGLAIGPKTFMLGQFVIGVATSGMLICPMTLAAKQMSAARFGLWSGVILSLGNVGMLLSSSPLAWIVERFGWRLGFFLAAAFGILVALAVFALVPKLKELRTNAASPVSEMVDVLRIGLSRPLRGLMALSLVSLAASLVLRGLWGGPWLMQVKGFGRIEAGNALGLYTIALIVGPVCAGILDRKVGHRREVLAAANCVAALLLALLAAGAPHYPMSELFGLTAMPPWYDETVLVLIGFAVSGQPLLFGITKQLADAQDTGKALSAVNLSIFLGAALMQSSTGVVAAIYGIPAVLLFMAAALIVGTIVFLLYT